MPTWVPTTVTSWQFTVSRPHDHGILQSGLSAAASLVPDGALVRYVWVLPRPRHAHEMLDGGDAVEVTSNARDRRPPPWQRDMQQYTLYVNMGTAEMTAATEASREAVASLPQIR